MNTQTLAQTCERHGNHDDVEFDAYLNHINDRFNALVAGGKEPLFTTNAEGLWEAYLNSFPADQRQYHNCNACRHFIERFGGLVVIDANREAISAIWNPTRAPSDVRPGIEAMARLVAKAKVTGVFISSDKVWGLPRTGIWTHYSVTPPKAMLHRGLAQNAGQVMAEKKEDYKNVTRALGEFTKPMLQQALTLLNSDALYRSEKVVGPALWLYDLHTTRDSARGQARTNLTWKEVALAPAGFCHPRSSMIGTLLEDIAAGMNFDEVSRRFKAKMHPLQYQRPQAAPAAGNIAQAEKIVAQLGAAGALERRIARLDEIEAIWRPKPIETKPADEGVFGHLTPKGAAAPAKSMDIPAQTMTWDKFQRTVLPTAEAIELYTGTNENFTAFVTAVNPDAPPILQWDTDERRNPMSWYVWNGGASPRQYSLRENAFHKVSAVSLKPSMWNPDLKMEHQGEAVCFLLDGARETRVAGAALFPEILKSEFHGIRSTIEAYSRRAKMEGLEEGSACGLMLSKGNSWKARIRVTSKGQTLEYKLDRWD